MSRVIVDGGDVRPHVQAFADACAAATGARSFGTYPGHQPSIDLAMDIFHAIGDDNTADAICEFFFANWEYFGGDYIISRQHIWNPPDRAYWRAMEDRGGPTQNHLDHCHVSFLESGDARPDPPSPPPDPWADLFVPILIGG